MSGICGIVGFDGAQPRRSDIEAMLEPLKRRGPDGANIWIGDGVALGHTLLATTPEALAEKLPLHHAESACTITADARLDNREELLAKLGLTDAGRGDGELILRAYLKWGQACVDDLLGDFAFAIWDSREQRLFCARDQMGMRQLTYAHVPGRAFMFATEPEAVVRHPAVSNELNPGRIADFLDNLEHSALSETFFASVSRLMAGHGLVVDPAGPRLRRYWQMRTPTPLRLGSDEEYSEAFLDAFRPAVRARLRSPGPVGAMLSGGMDSTSVAAVAAELLAKEGLGPLPTFSVLRSDPSNCPETRAINAALNIEGIDPHFINLDDMGTVRAELVELTKNQSEPFDWQMGLLRAVYLSAHQAGLKVVLDGAGGDVVLQSWSYLPRLLRAGQVRRALREARGEEKFWGADWPAWKALGVAAARAWIPRRLRIARRRALWWVEDLRIGRVGGIAAQFARDANLRERRRQLRARDSEFDVLDEDERRRIVEYARLVVGRERYDRVASAVAVEPRDPFMDLRVIEFCLSLPWEQVQADGWPKVILRRAMADRVPDPVRWRRGKEHLGGAFTERLFEGITAPGLSDHRFRETIARYIHLRRSVAGSGQSDGVEHCLDQMEAIWLYYWLNSPAGAGSSMDCITEGIAHD